MEIKMSGIKYQLDQSTEETLSISVDYATYDNGQSFNATVILKPELLEEGAVLDDLSKRDCDRLARLELLDWVKVNTTL